MNTQRQSSVTVDDLTKEFQQMSIRPTVRGRLQPNIRTPQKHHAATILEQAGLESDTEELMEPPNKKPRLSILVHHRAVSALESVLLPVE